MWPLLWAGVWKRTPVVPASRSSSSGSTRPQDRTSASASKCGTAIPTASCKSWKSITRLTTYLWIGTDGHGKNGAPYHIKDIVSDMEAAEAMIDTLYETLKTALK